MARKIIASRKGYQGPNFTTLQREMMDWLNTLSIAAYSLANCSELDSSALGSKARNVVHKVDENLHRLMNELEIWELRGRRAPWAVAHG